MMIMMLLMKTMLMKMKVEDAEGALVPRTPLDEKANDVDDGGGPIRAPPSSLLMMMMMAGQISSFDLVVMVMMLSMMKDGDATNG